MVRGTDSSSQLWQELVNEGYMVVHCMECLSAAVSDVVSKCVAFRKGNGVFIFLLWFHESVEWPLRSPFQHFDIWVTCHSLGGVMASLAAHWIKNAHQIPGNKIKLVTFGQPRTGDDEYSKLFNADLNYAFHVVNDRDMVPHIPFDSFYHHHKYEVVTNGKLVEVWFPDGMELDSKYAVCLNEAESDNAATH